MQDSRVSQPETRTESGSLIKPVIPQEAAPTSPPPQIPGDSAEKPQYAPQMPAVNADNPFLEKPKSRAEEQKAAQPAQPRGGQNRPAKQEWEDQKKVRDAAAEMAKADPAVKKIKVCYAVRNDEWWVILYEQGEGIFELKQYIWNKESEKLEPFLVYKTIPITRLQQHLTEEEPGKACEIMEPPPTGPGGQAPGPAA